MAPIFVLFSILYSFFIPIATDVVDERLMKIEFCADKPSLTITGFKRESESDQYAFFEWNEECYKAFASYIDQNSRLPNITKIERCSDEEMREDSHVLSPIYYFDTVFNVYLLKVWIGCPQPMCLFGDIDAASANFNYSAFIIFRGTYYWELRESGMVPSSSRAMRMTNLPGFFECAYLQINNIITIRSGKSYQFDQRFNLILISDAFKEFENCEAAVESEDGVAILKENQFLHRPFSPRRPSVSSRLPSELENPDACLVWNDRVHLFKRHFVFVSSQPEFRPEDFGSPDIHLRDFFRCSETINSAFDSFENFERLILAHKERSEPAYWSNININKTIKTKATASTTPESLALLYLAMIFCAIAVIVVTAFLTWLLKKKKIRLSSLILTSKSRMSRTRAESKSGGRSSEKEKSDVRRERSRTDLRNNEKKFRSTSSRTSITMIPKIKSGLLRREAKTRRHHHQRDSTEKIELRSSKSNILRRKSIARSENQTQDTKKLHFPFMPLKTKNKLLIPTHLLASNASGQTHNKENSSVITRGSEPFALTFGNFPSYTEEDDELFRNKGTPIIKPMNFKKRLNSSR
ncbi:hypothetical protein B4U79_18984 [Dinothrombium tinctorium]|uniref:CUB domain-containing protein n=1 Tax=Dinothrombium tinctorium TaxID=1965070 RepID=A0A3S3S8Z5_9ACAR|nr:hypothetical protein B4U79_18984 [Dinothrombium tinctorium]